MDIKIFSLLIIQALLILLILIFCNMDVCFFYYCYTVDLGFNRIFKKRMIIHPCYQKKLSISSIASKYNVSPDCVTRSLPKYFTYDHYNEYLL